MEQQHGGEQHSGEFRQVSGKRDRGREAGERGKSEAHAAREAAGESKQRRANSVEYDESMMRAIMGQQHGGEQHSGKFRDAQSEV